MKPIHKYKTGSYIEFIMPDRHYRGKILHMDENNVSILWTKWKEHHFNAEHNYPLEKFNLWITEGWLYPDIKKNRIKKLGKLLS